MRLKEILTLSLYLLGSFGLLLSNFGLIFPSKDQITLDFYRKTCPGAETVVQGVVQKKVEKDGSLAAALLRLQFHDCFVQGCDASILLRHPNDETWAPGNAGVMGFDVIDDIKAELEVMCPGVVSCADVVTLAARDAVSLVGGPFYPVLTGRRDGLTSSARNAANLPGPRESLEVLKSKFKKLGFSDRELVLLTAGAHTIGQTACFFVTPRPDMDSNFSQALQASCPVGGDPNVRVPLDWDGERDFDSHIFANIQSGRGVITSDAILYEDQSTRRFVDYYARAKAEFSRDFGVAMMKLGRVSVLSGHRGEIRRVCNSTNAYGYPY